jgi:hypothetical protein
MGSHSARTVAFGNTLGNAHRSACAEVIAGVVAMPPTAPVTR